MAVTNVLNHLNINFKAVNVLEDEKLRQGIKDFSDYHSSTLCKKRIYWRM